MLRETKVPIKYASYVLKDLSIGSSYSIRLAICTKGGCKKSNLKEISIEVPDGSGQYFTLLFFNAQEQCNSAEVAPGNV